MVKHSKYIQVNQLIKKFNFEILYKGNLRNRILIPSLNRTGIELASKTHIFRNIISAVLWSSNESKFLSQLGTKLKIQKAISNVLKLTPPVVIVTESFTHRQILLKIAKKFNITILSTSLRSAELYITVAGWINENLVEYKTIHGTLVSIYGVGVLLQGKSGVGKSESALELVKRGHIFVADDAVDVAKITDRLYGKANSLAQNFIEVRGLGVLNIARMFGVEKTKDSTNIDVIIDIIADDNSKMQFERLGKNLQYKMIEKVKVPYYRLPSTVGRKISDLIETTVIDLKLKLLGYNSAQEYINRYRKVNRSNNKNIV